MCTPRLPGYLLRRSGWRLRVDVATLTLNLSDSCGSNGFPDLKTTGKLRCVWSRERNVEIDLICLHEILETSRRLSGSAGLTSANNIPCVEEVLVHLPWWQISLYLFILKLVSVLIGNGTTEVLCLQRQIIAWETLKDGGVWIIIIYLYLWFTALQSVHALQKVKENISDTYCDSKTQ